MKTESDQVIEGYSLRKQLMLIIGTSLLISLIYGLMPQMRTTIGWLRIIMGLVHTSLIWLGCMFIVTKLWNKFPWEKQPVKHLIAEVIFIPLYANLIMFGWGNYIRPHFSAPITCELHIEDVMITNLITLFITSLHEAFFFYKQWQLNFSKSVRLERDHLEAKFEILKAQLNPHFLFNSLNSLTAMLDDNPEAEQYVQDLSYFMRYILKNRDNELIPLCNELEMIEKYIALQKVRFEENLNVDMQIESNCDNLHLPPLSLQILIENCIKHNIITSSKPLSVKVHSDQEKLTITNNLQPKQNVSSSGQGLRNIVERYSYYTQKEVEIVNDGKEFIVRIPLIRLQ